MVNNFNRNLLAADIRIKLGKDKTSMRQAVKTADFSVSTLSRAGLKRTIDTDTLCKVSDWLNRDVSRYFRRIKK